MNYKLIYKTERLIYGINYTVTIKADAIFYTVEIRHPSSYYGYFLRYCHKTQFSHIKGTELHNALVNDAVKKARLI